MCEVLLSHRADVNARCSMDGLSALHWSAHLRYAQVTSGLLAGMANPRLQDRRGQDALMKLVRRDMDRPAPGCAWTWKAQPGRDALGPELKGSGLMTIETARAAGEAEPECAGFCVRFRYSGATAEPSGLLAVSLRAAPSPYPEAPKRAVKKNGEEEEEDDEGEWTSYLRIAVQPAHDVRDLLANGADAVAQDIGGLTPLHHHLISAPSGGSVPVVSELLRGAADVNLRDETARATTPLLLAVGAKRADLVRLMLSESWPPADVDVRTSEGVSALALAEAKGARVVADLLRKAGASIWSDAEVQLGRHTVLHIDTRRPARAEA